MRDIASLVVLLQICFVSPARQELLRRASAVMNKGDTSGHTSGAIENSGPNGNLLKSAKSG
jgi:hypothetical protein